MRKGSRYLGALVVLSMAGPVLAGAPRIEWVRGGGLHMNNSPQWFPDSQRFIADRTVWSVLGPEYVSGLPRLSQALSPDGSFYVSSSGDMYHPMALFRTRDNSQIVSYGAFQSIDYNPAISPDGAWLVDSVDDYMSGLLYARLYDLTTGSQVAQFPTSSVPCPCFDGSGTSFAFQGTGSTVYQYRTSDRALLRTYPGGGEWTALSADGSRLAAHTSGSVTVYRTSDGAQLWSLPGFSLGLYGLAFTPDGTGLITAGGNGKVTRWSMTTGLTVWADTVTNGADTARLSVSSDGTKIAVVSTGSANATVIDAADGSTVRLLAEYPISIIRPQCSGDGRYIMALTAYGPTMFRASDSSPVRTFPNTGDPLGMSYDGRYALLGPWLVDTTTGVKLRSYPTLAVKGISPNGQFVVTAYMNYVTVYRVSDNAIMWQKFDMTGGSVIWSPSGDRFSLGGQSEVPVASHVYRTSDGTLLANLSGQISGFSPDGSYYLLRKTTVSPAATISLCKTSDGSIVYQTSSSDSRVACLVGNMMMAFDDADVLKIRDLMDGSDLAVYDQETVDVLNMSRVGPSEFIYMRDSGGPLFCCGLPKRKPVLIQPHP